MKTKNNRKLNNLYIENNPSWHVYRFIEHGFFGEEELIKLAKKKKEIIEFTDKYIEECKNIICAKSYVNYYRTGLLSFYDDDSKTSLKEKLMKYKDKIADYCDEDEFNKIIKFIDDYKIDQ